MVQDGAGIILFALVAPAQRTFEACSAVSRKQWSMVRLFSELQQRVALPESK